MTKKQQVELAAQTDLILLTVEMLRPPQLDPGNIAVDNVAWRYDSWPEWRECLRTAGLPHSTNKDGVTLESALREVFEVSRATTLDEWSDEYWRLFEGQTECAINQASYDRRDKGTILGDVAGFYRAFGWERAAHTGERPDHLRCQLEFVAVLLVMACQAPTGEEQEVVTDGLRQFARVHMHDWLPSFGWHLCEVTQLPMYGAIATWLVMLWDGLTAYHGWPADERTGSAIEPQHEPENPYECGAAGLVQLGEH